MTRSDPKAAAGLNWWREATPATHLVVSLAAGVVAGLIAAVLAGWGLAGLVAWIATAATFLLWTWTSIWAVGAADTARLAQREDGSRVVRDGSLLVVSVTSLVIVAVVIFRAHENGPVLTVLGVVSIAASWLVLHTVLTLRYARLYYADPPGGLDFNQDSDPTFRDFAYVAFTVGMTFQVSDTTIQKSTIRATVMGHGLASFMFDAVIIAVTVNVLAGLGH